MVVVSYKMVREFGKQHPQFFDSLDLWYNTIKRANWANIHDVKASGQQPPGVAFLKAVHTKLNVPADFILQHV